MLFRVQGIAETRARPTPSNAVTVNARIGLIEGVTTLAVCLRRVRMSAVASLVCGIVQVRPVRQVVNVIVRWVAIQMTDDQTLGSWPQEGMSDRYVDLHSCLMQLALADPDVQVAVPIWVGLQNHNSRLATFQ